MTELNRVCDNCIYYAKTDGRCIIHDFSVPPEASCGSCKVKELEVVENEQGGKQHKREYRSQALFPKALLEVSKVRYEAVEIHGYEDDNYKNFPKDEHLGRALTHLFSAMSDGYATGLSRKDDLSHAACRILMELEMEIERIKKEET